MLYQIPSKGRWVTLKKEWLVNEDGIPVTISALVSSLKALQVLTVMRADETLRLRVVFHEKPHEIADIITTGRETNHKVEVESPPAGHAYEVGDGSRESSSSSEDEDPSSRNNSTGYQDTNLGKRARDDLSDDELLADQRGLFLSPPTWLT